MLWQKTEKERRKLLKKDTENKDRKNMSFVT